MKRFAILSLVAVVFALAPAAVNAQGLIGAGLPGMPALFGGYAGGPSACGEKCPGLTAGTNLYVGWMDDPKGVNAKFTPEGTLPTLAGVSEIRREYPIRGLWLGLTQSVPLSENLAIIGSGWYLVPSDQQTTEVFTLPGIQFNNSWSTKSQWWFVDGLLALGCGGNVQLLAGLRYDFFTTKFTDPSLGFFTLPTDTSDVRSEGWIPLFGLQYAQASGNSNLLFRIVGVPTLLGSVRYRRSVLNTFSLEGNGNYNGGYFLEAFAQYGWNMGGMGNIGVFGRYNVTGGHSVINFDLLPLAQNADYRLGLNRYTWTLGAEFSLNFSIPYM